MVLLLLLALLLVAAASACQSEPLRGPAPTAAASSAPGETGRSAPVARAFTHLNRTMDLYHAAFDVYSDADAGGNHYSPSLWLGDWSDLRLDSAAANARHGGATSIRIDYSAATTKNGWAGI